MPWLPAHTRVYFKVLLLIYEALSGIALQCVVNQALKAANHPDLSSYLAVVYTEGQLTVW